MASLGLFASPSVFLSEVRAQEAAPKSLVHPFGPRLYLRDTGAPVTHNETATLPANTDYCWLTVVRRTSDAKARIKVNGHIRINAGDFEPDRLVLRKLVAVSSGQVNLEITPLGAPGGRVEVLLTALCPEESIPFESRNSAHLETVWEQTFSTGPEQFIPLPLENLNGLFWLEVDNGAGPQRVTQGQICVGDDHCWKARPGTERLPIVPGLSSSLRVNLAQPQAGQVQVRLIGICVDPETDPEGATPVLAEAKAAEAESGLCGKVKFKIYNGPLLVSPCETKCFPYAFAGVACGSLKLRIANTDKAVFAVGEVEQATFDLDIVEGLKEREVSGDGTFCIKGKEQGKTTIELVECEIVSGVVVDEQVLQSFTLVIKDYFFTIEGQCPARNCPSTDECGPLPCMKADGYSLLLNKGLFMPAFTVLPGVEGRNGLSPNWTLRFNSQAYSCGGNFGTSPFMLPCFQRLKTITGGYAWLESKLRNFNLDTTVSNSAVSGWTGSKRYEVLYQSGTELILRGPGGFKLVFQRMDESFKQGTLKRIENRFGDTVSFTYDACGELTTVTDVYGRTWTFTYDSFLRVTKIAEAASPTLKGRDVEFFYDSSNRLERIRLAKVLTDGGIGNTFSSGKNWRFTYAASSDLQLATNIIGIIAPNEDSSLVPFVINTYGSSGLNYDRVTAQTLGGTNASGRAAGGNFSYVYDNTVPLAQTTLVTDRVGNETLYTFTDCHCHVASVVERTNRGIRSGEGDYTTSATYNADGELTSITYPEGNSVTYSYDTGNTNRNAHGNLLTVTRVAGTRGGDGAGSSINDIVQKYTYEPIFQNVRTASDPRGLDLSYSPPESNGSVRAIDFDLTGTSVTDQRARYSSLTIFDYQEGNSTSIQSLGTAQKQVVTTTQANALALNTDRNGDSLTNQQKGNVIETCAPVAMNHNSSFSGRETQSIVTNYRYNSFGLLTASIDAEGYVSEYFYGSSSTPNTGTPSASTGGYLLRTIMDTTTSLRTPIQSTARTNIQSDYTIDQVGMRAAMTNGRGITDSFIYNELNQVQKSTRAASVPMGLTALNYVTSTFYDANNNVVKTEIDNLVPDSSGAPVLDSGNPKITSTMVYDILDQLISSTQEVQSGSGETRSILGTSFTTGRSGVSNTLTSETYYDKQGHAVLQRTPLSVSSVDINNVSSSITDERGLPYKSTSGGIDSQFSTANVLPHAIPGSITTTSLTATRSTNYDGNKNAVSMTDAEDNGSAGADTSTVLYDGFDRALRQTDAFGNYSLSVYDVASQVTLSQSWGPEGGNLPANSTNNKLLSQSHAKHDELGRAYESSVDRFDTPNGTILDTYTSKPRFDRRSLTILARNPRGYTSSIVYDGLGRSVLSTDAKSNTVETIYDNNSNVLQTKRTEVETSTQIYYSDFQYDAADRQILSVDTLGNTHRSFYDSTSQLVASTDANSSGTASIATQSRGGSFSITGNSNGNRIFYLTDRLGRSLATIRELRVNHDGANSVDTTNSYNSDGLITTSTFYDDNSRVTSRTDDKNNATSYAYDALNRKTSETFADSNSRSWTYDKDGHILSFTDPNGSVISTNAALGLDANGRLIKQTFSSGSGVATLVQQLFEYDGLSRVTKSTNDTGASNTTAVTECSFDSLSRCLSEIQTLASMSRTVSQSYDANSNLTTLTYPSSLTGGSNDAVTYTYDELDRVSLAKLNSNDVAAYTFQGPGRINTRDLYANSTGGNPVTTTVTYDGNARIQGLYTNPISKTNGFGGLIFLTNYDRANNVLCDLAQVEAFAGFLYGKDLGTDFYYYDSAYRVIGERRGVSGIAKAGFAGNNTAGNPPTGAAADQRTWLLDGVTNRPEETTQIGAGTPTTLNRTINSVNEYTQVGATSRSHDRNGNLIDDGTFLYTYDPLNRLVGVKSISSGAARQTNVYDCKGRRVGKTDSDKYRYTYAGMSLIDESFLTGGEYRQYLLGGRGERFKVRQTTGPGGSVEEFLYIEKLDGSVVAHVNASREMVAYYDYRLQGTVEAFDPGTDGEFFSADDGVMAVDSVRGSYFANGNRFDVETGLINQEGSTRFIDPVNWRKIQPSVDMWVWSQWGLRYNKLEKIVCGRKSLNDAIADKKKEMGAAYPADFLTEEKIEGRSALKFNPNYWDFGGWSGCDVYCVDYSFIMVKCKGKFVHRCQYLEGYNDGYFDEKSGIYRGSSVEGGLVKGEKRAGTAKGRDRSSDGEFGYGWIETMGYSTMWDASGKCWLMIRVTFHDASQPSVTGAYEQIIVKIPCPDRIADFPTSDQLRKEPTGGKALPTTPPKKRE